MTAKYRAAAAAYIRGHDRIWEVDRMRGGLAAVEPPIEWSAPPPPPSFGVGVAVELEFHRGPGNLRRVADEQGGRSHD